MLTHNHSYFDTANMPVPWQIRPVTICSEISVLDARKKKKKKINGTACIPSKSLK